MSDTRPVIGPAPLNKRDWWLGAGMFVVALWGRLLFVLTSADRAWPHSAWFQGDAPLWADWAGAIGRGEEFEKGLAVHSPAVAYLLHWMGYGAPGDYSGAKIVWCVCSALACPLSYFALRMEVCRRAAAAAGALLAFSFASYLLAASLNGEALYATLLPLMVMGTLRLARRPSVVMAGGLGVVHGAAMLIRPEHTLLLVMMIGWNAWAWRGSVREGRMAIKRVGLLAAVGGAAVAVCLPWSVLTAEATAKFNKVAPATEYERSVTPWTADGRSALESLPAFARHDNFEYLSFLARQRGLTQITGQTVRDYFQQEFGYWPEPLRRWSLVSGQGALSFALANHPVATGGFSKGGLDARFAPDPALNFGQASHLYLYNHGYRAGWDTIRKDPGRWVSLVGAKLAIFAEGATQGLTAMNLPLGLSGQRRAVDLFTARGGAVTPWRVVLGALFIVGLVAAVKRRVGALWLVIILYKVAVTVAFYGYARQAASVLPAFAAFAGLGVDASAGIVIGWARSRMGGERPRRLPWLWVIPVLALMAVDGWTALRGRAPVVTGNSWAAPRWGAGAFESFSDLSVGPGR